MTPPDLADGEVIGYTYTPYGSLKSVAGNLAYITDAQEDYLRRTTSIAYGNGLSINYQFDPTTMRTTRMQVPGVMQFSYQYDKVGNITSKNDPVTSANEIYTYDELNRLKTATGVYGAKTYVYDKINNLMGMNGTIVNTYSTTQVHALTGDGTHTYTYDANGNMLTKNLSGSPVSTYTYDNQNRLTQVGMGANSSSFLYDDMRQRISKTDITASTNKTTVYWFDDFEQTFDNNASGVLLETTKSYHAFGKKIAQRTSSDSALLYLYQDHLSSTSVVTNNLGTVVSRLQYEPYGKLASANNDKVKELFTGQDWDASTDLYYYNARYYNPAIGRFIQADPAVCDAQYNASLNLGEMMNPFMYCNNNPVVYTDPTGLDGEAGLNIGVAAFMATLPQSSMGGFTGGGDGSGSTASGGDGNGKTENVNFLQVAGNWLSGFGNAASNFMLTAADFATWGENGKFNAAVYRGDILGAAFHLAAGVTAGVITLATIGGAGEVSLGVRGAQTAAKGGESFFRSMSNAELAALEANGGLSGMAGKELFVSTAESYSRSFLGKSGYDVLVQFIAKPGTLNAMSQIGVRNGAQAVVDAGFGSLPKVSSGWMQNMFNLFKGERGVLNVGLGSNPSVFNQGLSGFKVIK